MQYPPMPLEPLHGFRDLTHANLQPKSDETRIRYNNGDVFVGKAHNNLPIKGTIEFNTGGTFAGTFDKQGFPLRGKMEKDGIIYEGTFSNNNLTQGTMAIEGKKTKVNERNAKKNTESCCVMF